MNAFLLCLVFSWLGELNLDELDKYQVGYDFNNPKIYFITSKDSVVVEILDYEFYNTNNRHSSEHDNGKRLRLKSKLGFTLENIPLYHNRFYNECIEIFLEIERELPKAIECMKSSGMNTADIRGLRFSFPYQPVIDEKYPETTKFWCANGYSCTADGKMIRGAFWVAGVHHGDGLMEITLSPRHGHITSIHEYIHASGYKHYCDTDKSLEDRIFKCAERVK